MFVDTLKVSGDTLGLSLSSKNCDISLGLVVSEYDQYGLELVQFL